MAVHSSDCGSGSASSDGGPGPAPVATPPRGQGPWTTELETKLREQMLKIEGKDALYTQQPVPQPRPSLPPRSGGCGARWDLDYCKSPAAPQTPSSIARLRPSPLAPTQPVRQSSGNLRELQQERSSGNLRAPTPERGSPASPMRGLAGASPVRARTPSRGSPPAVAPRPAAAEPAAQEPWAAARPAAAEPAAQEPQATQAARSPATPAKSPPPPAGLADGGDEALRGDARPLAAEMARLAARLSAVEASVSALSAPAAALSAGAGDLAGALAAKADVSALDELAAALRRQAAEKAEIACVTRTNGLLWQLKQKVQEVEETSQQHLQMIENTREYLTKTSESVKKFREAHTADMDRMKEEHANCISEVADFVDGMRAEVAGKADLTSLQAAQDELWPCVQELQEVVELKADVRSLHLAMGKLHDLDIKLETRPDRVEISDVVMQVVLQTQRCSSRVTDRSSVKAALAR